MLLGASSSLIINSPNNFDWFSIAGFPTSHVESHRRPEHTRMRYPQSREGSESTLSGVMVKLMAKFDGEFDGEVDDFVDGNSIHAQQASRSDH